MWQGAFDEGAVVVPQWKLGVGQEMQIYMEICSLLCEVQDGGSTGAVIIYCDIESQCLPHNLGHHIPHNVVIGLEHQEVVHSLHPFQWGDAQHPTHLYSNVTAITSQDCTDILVTHGDVVVILQADPYRVHQAGPITF